jgi:PAS domain-containing protein
VVDHPANWFMKGMSYSVKRRRHRRSGATRYQHQFQPVSATPAARIRLRARDLVAGGTVAIVALALVALIWLVTGRTIQDQRLDVRARAEQVLAGQAATIAETVSHELEMIDQSLSIIQDAWRQDSAAVNLVRWRDKLPALTAVAEDVFISDERHVIRQDIVPQAVGQSVGGAYATLPNGTLETLQPDGTAKTDDPKTQAQAGPPIEARRYLMYMIRGLDHPAGWLLGASYRSAELTRLFAQAALGFNAVAALVDTQHGGVQAVVGPAARDPILDISNTPMYDVMTRSPAGTWLGPTSMDGVMRLHAFHRVGDRDAMIVVAASWARVMAPANALAATARGLAGAATVLVLLVAGALSWGIVAFRGYRRHERQYERNKTELERLRADEASSGVQAQLAAARIDAIVANASDGIALFDAGLRLTRWNTAFARGFGTALQADMPLEALVREHLDRQVPAEAGIDPAAEVAGRIATMCAGDVAGLPQRGPDGEELILRGLPLPTGELVLLLNGFTTWQPAPPPVEAVPVEPVPVSPAFVAIEW